jgi:hypothetical protein
VASCGTEKWWGNQTCVYTYAYGDRSVTTGHLYLDTFTFAGAVENVAVPDLAFGCGFFDNGLFVSNETGIAGFGRGTLSLPSQLKVDKLTGFSCPTRPASPASAAAHCLCRRSSRWTNFSYCFTSMTGSSPSTVLLGLPANLYRRSARGSVVQTTPLIRNPADETSYYLSLKGVSVGSTRLPVPDSTFALTNGTGGTIIDSGTALTRLPPQVYAPSSTRSSPR